MDFLPLRCSYLALELGFGMLLHAMLWARNARFLWAQRRTIAGVVLAGALWMLITDPLGGHWGAWYFASERVLGIWLFGVMPIEDLIGNAIVTSAAACAVLVFGYGPRRWI